MELQNVMVLYDGLLIGWTWRERNPKSSDMKHVHEVKRLNPPFSTPQLSKLKRNDHRLEDFYSSRHAYLVPSTSHICKTRHVPCIQVLIIIVLPSCLF